jgi:branched-chain amino acid aminotransferase
LVDVDESPIPLELLPSASEAFITSSTRDVHAVGVLDGRPLPAPGPITAAVQSAWKDLGVDP